MSYASYERLPGISSYMTAKTRLSVTQPLRATGKKTEDAPTFKRYPLSANRRDTQFLIREVGDAASEPCGAHYDYKSAPGAKDGDIELLLYKQPVITFHKTPDGSEGQNEFTLSPGWYGRWSSADCYFIGNILYRYFAQQRTTRDHLVLSTHTGERYTIKPKAHMRFKYDEATRTLTPVQDEVQTTLRLNRKATNIVRARYGEFYRYMKGMIGVRKEQHEQKFYDHRTQTTLVVAETRITIPAEEWQSVVPMEPVAPRKGVRQILSRLPVTKYMEHNPMHKPAKLSSRHELNPATNRWEAMTDGGQYKGWLEVTEELITLASSPNTDPDQHEKFHKAFVFLAFYALGGRVGVQDLVVEPRELNQAADTIIFKYHSEEVFERVPVKEGAMPNLKYESWITREVDA